MTGLSPEGEALVHKIKQGIPRDVVTTAVHNWIWSAVYDAEKAREKPKKCVGHPVGDWCYCFGEGREPMSGATE
jgi:hypothetical protein